MASRVSSRGPSIVETQPAYSRARPRAVLTPRVLAHTFGIEAQVLERKGAPVIIPWSLAGP